MNRRATDVDRALSVMGGVQMNYISFGPRKVPETPAELKDIFVYNELGEGEYRAPERIEPEPIAELPGLPEQQAPMPLPIAARHEQAAPLPEPSRASEHEPLPSIGVPFYRQMPPEPPRAEPGRRANEGFGLPELWRERRDVRNPNSAPVVEERSLETMFRMLGNRTHGTIPSGKPPESGSDEADRGDLFRRL